MKAMEKLTLDMVKGGAVVLLFSANTAFAQEIPEFEDPIKLSTTVNSAEEESLPLLSPDGNTLYFVKTTFKTSEDGGVEELGSQNIMYSEKSGENWGAAKEDISLNNKENNAVTGISADGNTLYLLDAYEGKKEQSKGISWSKNSGGKWSDPETVPIDIKIQGYSYGFYVTPEEDLVIISIIGENTVGEEDLYISTKSGGSWSTPVHLGASVNSKGYEISPYLSPDRKHMYFASNGHGGMGNCDIFMCTRQDESWTNWSIPVNMGDKINSAGFDAYFTMTADSVAYFSSSRGGGYADIYTTKIVPPPPPPIEPVEPDTPVVVEPVEPDPPKTFEKKIYFELNSSLVDSEAKKTLDEVIAKLKEDSNKKVEINSYADVRATIDYNIWLTKRRADKTKAYLKSKGISSSRISTNWHGEKDPACPKEDCSEDQHRLSRRTTLVVK
jgi:OOP family OmpA-OmpF porin